MIYTDYSFVTKKVGYIVNLRVLWFSMLNWRVEAEAIQLRDVAYKVKLLYEEPIYLNMLFYSYNNILHTTDVVSLLLHTTTKLNCMSIILRHLDLQFKKNNNNITWDTHRNLFEVTGHWCWAIHQQLQHPLNHL